MTNISKVAIYRQRCHHQKLQYARGKQGHHKVQSVHSPISNSRDPWCYHRETLHLDIISLFTSVPYQGSLISQFLRTLAMVTKMDITVICVVL